MVDLVAFKYTDRVIYLNPGAIISLHQGPTHESTRITLINKEEYIVNERITDVLAKLSI